MPATKPVVQVGTAKLAKRIRGSHPPALAIFGWGRNQNGRITGHLARATITPSPLGACQPPIVVLRTRIAELALPCDMVLGL